MLPSANGALLYWEMSIFADLEQKIFFMEKTVITEGKYKYIEVGEGTPIVITAYPDGDLEFASWGGDCSGKEKSCMLNMNSGKKVTAEFRQQNYTLSISVVGRGKVKSVDLSRGEEKSFDAKIDCGKA